MLHYQNAFRHQETSVLYRNDFKTLYWTSFQTLLLSLNQLASVPGKLGRKKYITISGIIGREKAQPNRFNFFPAFLYGPRNYFEKA